MTAVPTLPRTPARWRQSAAALVLGVAARVVLGALALLLTASVLPALVGWQSSVVMSGSMSPVLEPGDVAVLRPVATDQLTPGQVLLVDDPDVPGRLRLHRLVAVQDDGLLLKGDANPAVDGSLVAPDAVHGALALALPLIGRPTVWLAEGLLWPVAGACAGLLALVGLALAHRRPDDHPDDDPDDEDLDGETAPPPPRADRRRPPPVLRRVVVPAVAAVLAVSLPGAAAVFSDTSRTPSVTLPVALWWNCPDVSGPTGANAARYYPLQESTGRTARNTGTAGAAADGTYSTAGVTYRAAGPACGAGLDKAVTFNGTSGAMWTTQAVANPQTFSVQAWFATSTTLGGKLIGFGNGANGAASTQYDRHVYLTDTGKLVFGIYSGSYLTVTTPASYNDGRWHLVTATYSAATGMRLYVDDALIVSAAAGPAENYTGYWRIGYDVVHAAWPGAPQTGWFAGSMAHVGIFGTVLSAQQVDDQYDIAR